jgi:hypothetical protein
MVSDFYAKLRFIPNVSYFGTFCRPTEYEKEK